MSYQAVVELTAKSRTDLDEILVDVRILCTAMGVECELLPEGAGG